MGRGLQVTVASLDGAVHWIPGPIKNVRAGAAAATVPAGQALLHREQANTPG